MDDNEFVERLKDYLRERSDQDTKNLSIGDELYSTRELYEHVEEGTETGNKFIQIAKRHMEIIFDK